MADSELGHWEPLGVREAATFLAGLPAPWWIAGGWAIDLFVGRQTRAHGDLDVEVLRRDQLVVQRLLTGWDLRAAGGGRLRRWPPAAPLADGLNSVWGRPAGDRPWAIQIMLAEGDGDRWVYRRDPRVSRPLAALGRRTPEGIPYLAPEVQLLYKARAPRPKDQADFERARLGEDGRRWLGGALALAHPGHPWLARL